MVQATNKGRAGPKEGPARDRAACEPHDTSQHSTRSIGVDTSCETCRHAELHGWWGPKRRGTHCRHCHRSWTGKSESHCVGKLEDGSQCCLHFSRDSIGNRHRVDGRCLTLPELMALRKSTGEPLFDLETRRSGPVVVYWRAPDDLLAFDRG